MIGVTVRWFSSPCLDFWWNFKYKNFFFFSAAHLSKLLIKIPFFSNLFRLNWHFGGQGIPHDILKWFLTFQTRTGLHWEVWGVLKRLQCTSKMSWSLFIHTPCMLFVSSPSSSHHVSHRTPGFGSPQGFYAFSPGDGVMLFWPTKTRVA